MIINWKWSFVGILFRRRGGSLKKPKKKTVKKENKNPFLSFAFFLISPFPSRELQIFFVFFFFFVAVVLWREMPSKLLSPGLPLCLSGFSLSHRSLSTEYVSLTSFFSLSLSLFCASKLCFVFVVGWKIMIEGGKPWEGEEDHRVPPIQEESASPDTSSKILEMEIFMICVKKPN